MNKNPNAFYDKGFYERQVNSSRESSKVILSILYDFFKPKSVLDVGCGRGVWLATAESLGSESLVGYDGSWVDQSSLESDRIEFRSINMETEFPSESTYDLTMSLEVAEHLPENRAADFVRSLCKSSNVILFSAAVKGQGGVNHINEQWQSYWIDLFKDNGFDTCDIFRSLIWDNEKVNFWYRQNIFLFVNREKITFTPETQIKFAPIPYNIVHPRLLDHKLRQLDRMRDLKDNPSLSFCLRTLKRFVTKRMSAN